MLLAWTEAVLMSRASFCFVLLLFPCLLVLKGMEKEFTRLVAAPIAQSAQSKPDLLRSVSAFG